MRVGKLIVVATLLWACALIWVWRTPGLPAAAAVVYAAGDSSGHLDRDLAAVLSHAGFTGDIERTFRRRLRANLGRPINTRLADLGRMLWFDNVHSLRQDNTCGGCHSPTHGFGDSQSMAIGVQNNGVVGEGHSNVVGPGRHGPRNQRRSPLVVNTALYPAMMWNGRFNSVSGDPFDNSLGFSFPVPEDNFPFTPDRFSKSNDDLHNVTHLLQAQAHMPPTEQIEVAGFTGTCPPPHVHTIPDPALGPDFCQFDDDRGQTVPLPDPSTGTRNEPIRQRSLQILNGIPAYRRLFHNVFAQVAVVPDGNPDHNIDFFMFGKAIAEFEFTLVFADAPIDQFARGDRDAMTPQEKRGALVFFGKAKCVQCHKVDGQSNEMFSDFQERVIGVPQIAPSFGVGKGNVIFAGPGHDEDFGREERTLDPGDRYKFRTAPLRNLAVSPGFFHNGAFINLEDAIRFHLNVFESARKYDPKRAGVPRDLTHHLGPPVPKELLDPLIRRPIHLSQREFNDLVTFIRDGLLDARVNGKNLCKLIPERVPSGLRVADFKGCPH